MDREKAKEIFKTCDLIGSVDFHSEIAFGAIVRQAQKGGIDEIRWLTEYGFISVRRGPLTASRLRDSVA